MVLSVMEPQLPLNSVEELKEAIIHACGGMTKEEMERRTNKT